MSRGATPAATVLQPQAVGLARTYAAALLAPLETASATELQQELTDLADLLGAEPGAAELLSAPVLSREDRQALVERVFGPRVSRPIANLLGVLAENGRLNLISAVARQFREAIDERCGRIDVTVSTAADLSELERQDVMETMRQALSAEPNVTWRTDPELLGGLVVQVGDAIYDASVSGQIDRLAGKMGAKQ